MHVACHGLARPGLVYASQVWPPGQAKPSLAWPCQVLQGQVCQGQARPWLVWPTQIWQSQARPGQAWLGQAKSDQPRPSLVWLGQFWPGMGPSLGPCWALPLGPCWACINGPFRNRNNHISTPVRRTSFLTIALTSSRRYLQLWPAFSRRKLMLQKRDMKICEHIYIYICI